MKKLSNKILPVLLSLLAGCSSVINRGGSASELHPGRNGVLTETEMQMARTAWQYFENNYQEQTGLVNAVDYYPSATLWDTASYLAGLVSAYELGIVQKEIFDSRMSRLLTTLSTLDFFNDELPNKAYNTKTAEEVDYNNQPGEIGFSALDLGRFLIWMKIISERYPEYSGRIDDFILRWNFCNIIDRNGTMHGAVIGQDKKISYLQEGRLGYEEYAAKGFQLWGFNTERASKPEPYNTVKIFNVEIPYDSRDPRQFGAHNYVVTENYVLDAIELNWDKVTDRTSSDAVHSDRTTADFASRIYEVQEKRYRNTGIFTARTEHQIDGPPYFVYDTIYTSGYHWSTITEAGKSVPQFAAVSLKAALGLWILWETEYTDLLFDKVSTAFEPARGFYEGIYENENTFIKTFTANNNGIILETLLYKEQGKLLKFNDTRSKWEKVLADGVQGRNKCLPYK